MSAKLAQPNPELTEAQAIQLCSLLDTHIKALQQWSRKLKQPFLPVHSHYKTTHATPGRPTAQTILHILVSSGTFRLELARALDTVVERRKEKEQS